MSDENKLVAVYSGNTTETGLIKGLLEDAGIMTFLKDEIIGGMAPFYATPGGVGAIEVVVAEKDIERAKAIIQDFLNGTSDE